jgi:alpha-N-arabinofuranosidase
MDFIEQIGSRAYLSINLGSGIPQEAAEWLEYMTASQQTTLAKERTANGHPEPYEVPYLGIGNESWDCGGNMSTDYYLSQLKIYTRFARNYNAAQQQGARQMLKIAVGPNEGATEWTEAIMKAYQARHWSWDMQGLSLHAYTVVKWPPAFASVGFGIKEYNQVLKSTLEMENLVSKHSAIMDKYDPKKEVALVVDEWGAWYAQLPGTHGGFLAQQNSLRDAVLSSLNLNIFARHADRVRMANIAQMINVLQAMILTDKEKMLLTPTYHVFRMYVPFQDAAFVPVTFNAGSYSEGLPRVDAIAARDASGKLWLEVTNLDPEQPLELETNITAKSAAGETLTAPKVDSVNTFEAQNTVQPKAANVRVQGGKVTLTLDPKSVTVISIQE